MRNGRAEMTDFFQLIFNQHVFLQFGHIVSAGLVTATCFVVGIAAYKIVKGSKELVFVKTLKLVIPIALASLILTVGFGDLQGKYAAEHQPMKLAAMEAQWETQKYAPLSLFSIIDEENGQNKFEIVIPGMLSFMAGSNFPYEVKGLNDLQKEDESTFGPDDYLPPVNLLFISFRVMVGLATLMIFILMLGMVFDWKKKLVEKTWLLKIWC